DPFAERSSRGHEHRRDGSPPLVGPAVALRIAATLASRSEIPREDERSPHDCRDGVVVGRWLETQRLWQRDLHDVAIAPRTGDLDIRTWRGRKAIVAAEVAPTGRTGAQRGDRRHRDAFAVHGDRELV